MVYVVMDWEDNPHLLSAKALCKRVKEDSDKASRRWLASAAELMRVTGRPFFSDKYAVKIRVMVLNFYASLRWQEIRNENFSIREVDEQALQECYNSLYGVEIEEAIMARRRYLVETISAITYPQEYSFDPVVHPSKAFDKFRKDWIQEWCLEYDKRETINFKKMNDALGKDWVRARREAEEIGAFREADQREHEALIEKIFDTC